MRDELLRMAREQVDFLGLSGSNLDTLGGLFLEWVSSSPWIEGTIASPGLRFSLGNTMKTAILRSLVYSAIGIIFFFLPVEFAGKKTIPLDHLVHQLKSLWPMASRIFVLAILLAGAFYPFFSGRWQRDTVTRIFSVLKLLGLVTALMAFFNWGPAFLLEKDMLPFLFQKLIVPVGLIVPLGAVLLAFLVGYGLLEFVGVLLEPVMRPIWKTPGRSAIDAVASFVGSYSIGLLITNRMYLEGRYSLREASIIATGFSTVSASFMVIVAKTLDLMSFWNFYFWSTMGITFLVTAITVRLPPLVGLDNRVDNNFVDAGGTLWQRAVAKGTAAALNAPPLGQNLRSNVIDGLKMAMSILPSIMSVGLIGLLLARYTPLFDLLGLLFLPLLALLDVPEPMLTASACAVGLAEMFLPALLVTDAPLMVKYLVGVVSVSSILFFSASIPCILSTEIKISIRHMVVIWFLRVLFSIPPAYLMGTLFLPTTP